MRSGRQDLTQSGLRKSKEIFRKDRFRAKTMKYAQILRAAADGWRPQVLDFQNCQKVDFAEAWKSNDRKGLWLADRRAYKFVLQFPILNRGFRTGLSLKGWPGLDLCHGIEVRKRALVCV